MSTRWRPRGLPITCVACVRPPDPDVLAPLESGIAIDGNTVNIDARESASFNLDYVYPEGATYDSIFERDIQRLVSAALNGFSVCVMALGPTGSGKNFSLFGGRGASEVVSRGGLAFLSVESLFSELRERVQASADVDSFELNMQYVEIFNDSIHDLLNPNGTNLSVEEGELGPEIPRLKCQHLADESDFQKWFNAGHSNRTMAMSEFGPFSDRASVILTLHLTQTIGPKQERLVSKIVFVCLPGCEKLSQDIKQLRATEGLQINREIIAFGNMCKSLKDPEHADFANYNESFTTQILSDCLGGNSITICLATLTQKDLNGSLAALKYSNMLQSVVNFPVVNDERNLGLIRTLRMQIMTLTEDLKGLRARQGDVGEGGRDSKYQDSRQAKEKILDLQGKILQAERGRAQVLGEKQKTMEILSGLRGKYRQLLQSKTEIQGQLIDSEAERLKMSKMLIDMQMEDNDMKETLSKEKYEMETKLLTTEGDIVELQVKEKQQATEITEKAKRVEELLDERKSMSLEYIALRQNFENVKADLNKSLSKTETLGMELLNLVNAKKELEEQKKYLEDSNSVLEKSSSMMVENREKLETRILETTAEIETLRKENETLSLQMVQKDIELKTLEIEFEGKKVHMEKSYIDFTKEKEREFNVFKQATDKEQRKVMAMKVEVEKNNVRLQGDLKDSKRRVSTLEEELASLTDENASLQTKLAQFREKVAQQAESYRHRLLSYVNQSKASGQSKEPRGESQEKQEKDMFQDLIDEHLRFEKEFRQEAEEARTQSRLLIRKLRKLKTLYKDLVHFVEDVAPAGLELPGLKENELNNMTEEVIQSEASWQAEIDTLRQKSQAMQRTVDNVKEDMVRQAENHKKETDRLQVKCDVALSRRDELIVELHTLKETHSNCDPMSRKSREEHEEALVELKLLQEELREQLELLKSSGGFAKAQSDGSAGNAEVRAQMEDLRRSNMEFRNRVNDLVRTNERLKKQKGQSDPMSLKDLNEIEDLKRQVSDLRKQARAAEEANARVLARPSTNMTAEEVERERAAMAMKCARAEAQLAQFQAYMRQQVTSHRKQLRKYKKEAALWKEKASGVGSI